MIEKLRERAVEFVAVAVLLAGLLYAATETYRNSVRIDRLETTWTDKEKSLETRFSDLRTKFESESKGMRKALVALMVKSGSSVEELQTIVGDAINIQRTLEQLEGREPRRVGSDLDLKTNVQVIVDPLARLHRIRGITFEWRNRLAPWFQQHG